MKLAFVVPRYGPGVRGGAENGARMLAERLVVDRGWEVEVFTTCAIDAITWRDELAARTEVVHGVTVHRIRSVAGRDENFHPLWALLREDPGSAGASDMERWVDLQGPCSPDLVAAMAESDADVVAFYPYLYYPTVRGLPLVEERACCIQPRTRSPRYTCRSSIRSSLAAGGSPFTAGASARWSTRASAWQRRRRCSSGWG